MTGTFSAAFTVCLPSSCAARPVISPFPRTPRLGSRVRVITTEGWIHDERPYGEYTGTYGEGLPHNHRFVVDCIAHRNDAIYNMQPLAGCIPVGQT